MGLKKRFYLERFWVKKNTMDPQTEFLVHFSGLETAVVRSVS